RHRTIAHSRHRANHRIGRSRSARAAHPDRRLRRKRAALRGLMLVYPDFRKIVTKRDVKFVRVLFDPNSDQKNRAKGTLMRARQALWTANQGWIGTSDGPADLLLAFGSTEAVTDASLWTDLTRRHPGAIVLGCSTGGEIHGSDVFD